MPYVSVFAVSVVLMIDQVGTFLIVHTVFCL